MISLKDVKEGTTDGLQECSVEGCEVQWVSQSQIIEGASLTAHASVSSQVFGISTSSQ